jgi:hypothetical protein
MSILGRNFTVIALLFAAAGSRARTDILLSAGLSPGAQFRLVFVSSRTHIAARVLTADDWFHGRADNSVRLLSDRPAILA